MKKIRALMAALMMISAAAQAELVTIDSPAGRATAVLDTNTNLEWLKLSASQSLSINQVLAQTATGGRLDTFAYASLAQLCELTIPNIQLSCAGGRTEDTARVLAFFSLFNGTLLRIDEGFGTYLQIDQVDAENRMGRSTAFRFFEGPPLPYIETDSQAVTLNERTLNQPALHWLVREHQGVPEPETVALLAIGAMLLAVFSRPKQIRRHH